MAYDIISADAHILEPTDIWETWLPQKYADKAPKLVKDVDQGDAWLFAGASEPDPIGLVSTPGMAGVRPPVMPGPDGARRGMSIAAPGGGGDARKGAVLARR